MTTPSNHSAANGTILAKDLVHSSFRPPFVKIYYQGEPMKERLLTEK